MVIVFEAVLTKMSGA